MLRVEVCTRALRASQNVKKKIDACLVYSLCLSGYMGVFSEDVVWLAFFVWRSPSGGEKDGKMCKAPCNHKVRGRARREARVPVVETAYLSHSKCC